ncbi:MAG: hypothetical protein ACREC5_07825, partial [Thermoplasmata archaeon]
MLLGLATAMMVSTALWGGATAAVRGDSMGAPAATVPVGTGPDFLVAFHETGLPTASTWNVT